jgi:hypothetical protein
MVNEEDSGLTGGVNAGLPILMTMGAFLTISLYNIIELTVIIFTTFKQRAGLYFWSFIVATWGIAPHAVGFTFKFFRVISTESISVTLVAIGWVAMVTGQSLVLYSRLHLVVLDANRIRWVLYMIIFDAIVFHIPTIVLAYGANSSNPKPFVNIFSIYDKIQIAIFFIQESIISVIYIYETVRLLAPAGEVTRKPIRQLLLHLILVNLVVLLFDITLLGIQYSGHYEIQTTYKAAVYSIKLKIEFSVLNRLVSVVQNQELSLGNPSSSCNNSYPFNAFTSGNSTQSNTLSSANYGVFVQMDDSCPPLKDGEQGRASTMELVIERGDTINCCNDTTRGRQIGGKKRHLDMENSIRGK